MKKVSLFTVVILSFLKCLASDFKITFSNSVKKNIYTFYYLTGGDESIELIGVFVNPLGFRKYYHLTFQKTSKLVSINKIESIEHETYLGKMSFDDYVYVLTLGFHGSSRTETIKVHYFDKKTKKFTHSQNIYSFVLPDNRRLADIILLSAGNSNFIVFYELTGKSQENKRVGYLIFNTNMELISKNESNLPFTNSEVFINDIEIGENAIYLGLKKETTVDRKQTLYQSYLYLLSLDTEKNALFPLELDNYHINNMIIFHKEDNNILITGVYSEPNRPNHAKGFFNIIANLDKKAIIKKYIKEIEEMSYTASKDKKSNKKNQQRPESEKTLFRIKKVIFHEDGSFTTFVQPYYVVVVETTSSQTRTTSRKYYYFHLNILAYKSSPDGEIQWIVNIPKKQVADDRGKHWASFSAFEYNNKIFIFYNDNVNNISNLASVQRTVLDNYKKIALVCVTIDNEHNITKSLVSLPYKSSSLLLSIPTNAFQYQEGKIIMPFYTSKRFALSIINLPM